MDQTVYVIMPDKGELAPAEPLPPEEGYPVLYLLHGTSHDCSHWLRYTGIERYSTDRKVAVVMPSVEVSGYADLAHGGNFYSYVAKELPAVMEGFFGFSRAREDNFVCGLSMGGAGALKIGLANPENYAAIGCLSAGIFNRRLPSDTKHIDPEKDRGMYIRYDGRDLEGSEEDLIGNAKKILAEGKPIPRIYHSTGSEDFLLDSAHFTRDFFTGFEGNPFDYVYEEDPGAHTWEYWDEHIQRFLKYISK